MKPPLHCYHAISAVENEKNVVELTLLLSSYFYGSVVVGIKRANPHLESMAYHQSSFVSDSSRLDSDTVQYQVRLCPDLQNVVTYACRSCFSI